MNHPFKIGDQVMHCALNHQGIVYRLVDKCIYEGEIGIRWNHMSYLGDDDFDIPPADWLIPLSHYNDIMKELCLSQSLK